MSSLKSENTCPGRISVYPSFITHDDCTSVPLSLFTHVTGFMEESELYMTNMEITLNEN